VILESISVKGKKIEGQRETNANRRQRAENKGLNAKLDEERRKVLASMKAQKPQVSKEDIDVTD